MRDYNYRKNWNDLLIPEIVKKLTLIHEYKGEQRLFIEAHKDELKELVEIAKVQSTEASNKIEGISTADDRLKNLVQAKTTPRNRDESEIAGYRDVLNTIHENYDYIPINANYILQLHRDLYKFLGNIDGGKAEYFVRQHQDNEVIAKLKSNKPLTSSDIKILEEILWSEVGTKQDYEAEYGEKPLGEFVREIVGLDMTAAKEAFAEYLDETNLDSRQIYFVNQIVEFIVHNGMMKDLSVLQEAPFTDQGSIVEVFTDLSVWMGIRRVIEQVNANALAA